jgi:hypothetical protein
MFWIFGSLHHENGEVLVTAFTARRLFTPRGQLDRIVKTAVIEGEILRSGQANIEARRDAIDAAYATDQPLAELRQDDGSGGEGPPTYQMQNPRVLDFVWLQEEHKAHFATALPFRAVIQSEEIYGGGLLSFSETLTKTGNAGQRVVWPELDNGPAIPQIVSGHTNVTIVQSGEAVGIDGWPLATGPLYPAFNLDNPSDTLSRTVTNSDLRPVYTTRWQYQFTFNANEPLGFPIPR